MFSVLFVLNIKVLNIFLVQPLTEDSDSDSHMINIGEIEAYDVNGEQLTLTIDGYSSQDPIVPINNTIDGDPSTIGHTFWEPVDLTVYNWFK